MTVLLIDRAMYEACLDEIVRIEAATGGSIEPVFIPPPDEQLTLEDLERIEIGTPPNGDYEPEGARRFYGGALHAPNIRWVHLPLAGIDDPVFGELLNAGVRLTNASGAMAEPIAWSAIAGLLQLARGFPRWAASQRRHEWETHPRAEFPRDLREQTIVVFGLGAIGMEIARLAQALHLHVIGVRRSPARDGDPVDELVTPAQLAEVLPRADWPAPTSTSSSRNHCQPNRRSGTCLSSSFPRTTPRRRQPSTPGSPATSCETWSTGCETNPWNRKCSSASRHGPGRPRSPVGLLGRLQRATPLSRSL
jgi:hypothetical protein